MTTDFARFRLAGKPGTAVCRPEGRVDQWLVVIYDDVLYRPLGGPAPFNVWADSSGNTSAVISVRQINSSGPRGSVAVTMVTPIRCKTQLKQS